jgi:hypothetical protein
VEKHSFAAFLDAPYDSKREDVTGAFRAGDFEGGWPWTGKPSICSEAAICSELEGASLRVKLFQSR